MPKSKIRTKKGRVPQKSKADRKRIEDSYYRKLDEYVELPMEELENLQVSGTYKLAKEQAIIHKKEILKAVENK